jgi:hypothetical protein
VLKTIKSNDCGMKTTIVGIIENQQLPSKIHFCVPGKWAVHLPGTQKQKSLGHVK